MPPLIEIRYLPLLTAILFNLSFSTTTIAKIHTAAKENPSLHLKSSFIGDHKQPAVSHFIRWQGSQPADSLRWNINQQPSNDVLKKIDRGVMKKRMDIYNKMELEKIK